MADLLALEWDHDQICGVLAQVSTGRIRVRRCFVLGRPAVAIAGSGPLPIDWLKSQLAAQGIAGGEVLVSLPRDEAVVKRIELPETSDDELPVLVRYQAGSKSSVPLSELSLDFIPLPRRNEVPGREVLMATVPQQTITEIRTLCEAAGLQLGTLGLTPAAVAELVARAEPHAGADLSGASLVVSRHGSRLEISVLRRCHLLFSHSARLSTDESGSDPQAIVAEVSRSLVALRGAIADVRIERVWTLLDAAAHQQLSEVLRKRLSCDVQPLDPFAGVELDPADPNPRRDGSQFAGPIGLLLARAEPRVPAIDFLAPRQPPVRRDTKKRRRVVQLAGCGVLALLLIGNHWLTISGLDKEIEDQLVTQRDLKERVDKGKPIVKSAQLVEEWEKRSVPWLDKLAELSNEMPATDRIYLKKIELTPYTSTVASAKSPTGDVIGRIKAECLARERSDVLGLKDKLLAADVRFRGVLISGDRSTTDDPNYPWKFTAEIQLAQPSKSKAVGKPTGAAPGAESPQKPEGEVTSQGVVTPPSATGGVPTKESSEKQPPPASGTPSPAGTPTPQTAEGKGQS